MYRVSYLVNKTGVLVKKEFDSVYKCRVFVNKLLHSKICTLISYPRFD